VPATCLVVIDEAYTEYAANLGLGTALAWLDRYPNLVVTRTFSKAYGLAGFRVGYGVSHPDIADLLNRVRQPFNVNLPALAAAEAGLGDTAHLARSVDLNTLERDRLASAARAFGLVSIPSAANFLCLDLGLPAMPVFDGLLRRGIIVRPVANYGLPEHLRITIGTEAENGRLIQALGEVLGL